MLRYRLFSAAVGLLFLCACDSGGGSGSEAATPAPSPAPAPTPTPAGLTSPVGIYALGGTESPSTQILDKPFVDGWVIRLGWNRLEQSQGVYDFSGIDNAVSVLESYNKKLTIVIFSLEVPDYIRTDPSVSTYNASTPRGDVQTAVSWDLTALSRWETFCQALSDHLLPDSSQPGAPLVALRDHPVLAQIDASIVGIQGVRDIGGRLVATPGYNRTTFTAAALRSMHAMVDRFPNKFRYLSFFRMSDATASPVLDTHLLDTFMLEFNSGAVPQLGFFQENLACDTPGTAVASALYNTRGTTYSMFQMLQAWLDPFSNPVRTDPCLVTTVAGDRSTAISGPEVGIAYGFNTFGTRYFEIYTVDLLHANFADDFQLWHGMIHQ